MSLLILFNILKHRRKLDAAEEKLRICLNLIDFKLLKLNEIEYLTWKILARQISVPYIESIYKCLMHIMDNDKLCQSYETKRSESKITE